jgi:hypothetical protein
MPMEWWIHACYCLILPQLQITKFSANLCGQWIVLLVWWGRHQFC